jgi:hypothetical protein
MSKPQLHVSGLNMLQGCGEQYRRRYIEGEIIAPSVALHVGSAVDRAVTDDLESKIKTGALLPDEQIKDIARDALQAKWETDGVSLDDDEIPGEAKGEAIDVAVNLAALHHRDLAPTINATAVQRAWTVEIDGFPVDLAGTIDIQEGSERIRDTKTSKKSPSVDEADKSLQLTTYALAAHVLDRQIPKELTLDYLVKLKTPKLQVVSTTREVADFDPFLERLAIAAKSLESGVFVPARTDDWRCTARFCGYFRSCKYAMRPKTVAVSATANGKEKE